MILCVSGAISGEAPSIETPVNIFEQYVVYIGMVILLIEYTLGKTTWIKPNSILELILVPVLKFLKLMEGQDKSKEKKQQWFKT